jgi:4-amino-4-deoxy-L-arabinose transferase-like glycosyltransferase
MRLWLLFGSLALVAALYLWRLDSSPLYLLNDEIHNAFQALSLATEGRSVAGDFFPVYFREPGFPAGRDPLAIYVTAAFLKAFWLSEVMVRLPTALIGIANVALAFLLGHRLSGRCAGLLMAACVAITPAHFILSRIGIAPLWPLPFLLGWLLFLARFSQGMHARDLFVAMACLGVAVFGYIGTAVLVPLYAVGTLGWLLWDVKDRQFSRYLIAAAGLLLPLTLLIYWQIVQPDRWTQLFGYYESGGSDVQPVRTLLNFESIQERVTTYWNYFDPTFLFLAGDDGLRYSTGRAGVFLLPSMILLPVGVYSALRQRGLGRLMVYGFFCSPLIGALQGRVHVQRVLPLVLFGALLSAIGAQHLLFHRSKRTRQLALALLAACAIQFTVFVVDYFGDYRLRSGAHRGGNVRGAVLEALKVARESNAPVIHFSENIPNADLYWRFYALATAPDLEGRGIRAQPARLGLDPQPSGALLIATSQEVPSDHPSMPNAWRLRTRIYELDGPTFYVVYEKVK